MRAIRRERDPDLGLTTTPFALFGKGAVAITELVAVLISVIPPPPLLTYTMAGLFAAFPVNCADARRVHTAQTNKIRNATERNRVVREEASSILTTLIVILSLRADAKSPGAVFE